MEQTAKRGRKAILFKDDLAISVQAMSQYGVPLKDIAAFIGISVPTLLKLYKKELEKGRAVANRQIGERLFKKAMDGDTTALIFWAKTQMGWRETSKIDLTSSDQSMSPKAAFDLSSLSPEQIAALRGELDASGKE